jgi:hypothetical membrane protein
VIATTDVARPLRLRSARLLGILLSAVVLAATVVVVGALTPGYRPWTDAVSRLGSHDEPHALFVRLGFMVYGLLIIAGAAPMAARVPTRTRLLAFLLGGYGAAAIVAGLAPKDPPAATHTFTSQVHVASTILGGAMLLFAIALVHRYAAKAADRRNATVIGALMVLAIAVFPFTWGTPAYGAIEISLLTSATGWLVALAAR